MLRPGRYVPGGGGLLHLLVWGFLVHGKCYPEAFGLGWSISFHEWFWGKFKNHATASICLKFCSISGHNFFEFTGPISFNSPKQSPICPTLIRTLGQTGLSGSPLCNMAPHVCICSVHVLNKKSKPQQPKGLMGRGTFGHHERWNKPVVRWSLEAGSGQECATLPSLFIYFSKHVQNEISNLPSSPAKNTSPCSFFISVHGNTFSPVALARNLWNHLTPLFLSQLHVQDIRKSLCRTHNLYLELVHFWPLSSISTLVPSIHNFLPGLLKAPSNSEVPKHSRFRVLGVLCLG